MENNYLLSLSRLDICDLMLACTAIVIDSQDEMNSPDCNKYRRENVLPGTIEKWQTLHDRLAKQLEKQDALYI